MAHLMRPPAAPAVYALVCFENAEPTYYVGSSRHLIARMSAHLSFARSVTQAAWGIYCGASSSMLGDWGVRWLSQHRQEYLSEFQAVAEIETGSSHC